MIASGTVPAATAVWNFVMTSAHGIVVTSTFASGFSSVKPWTKSGSFSPSSPIAQIVMSPSAGASSTVVVEPALVSPPVESSSARPHAVRARSPTTPMATALRPSFMSNPPHRAVGSSV